MVEIRFLEQMSDLRTVWRNEARDFTPWLASEEPLRHLLDECQIEMGSEPTIRTEVRVPGLARSLDILVELETGERIAIENQFSESDHDHLTRGLAYAVGLETTTLIVVAESHRPEFIAVAQYLNGAALAYEDHGIRVILVTVRLSALHGSSIVYPTFEILAEPDEWKAAAQLVAHEPSDRDTAIYDFHECMLPKLRETTNSFMHVNPSVNQWKSGALGIRGVSVTYGPRRESTFVQIWFSKSNAAATNHAGLAALLRHRTEVEEVLSPYSVDWRKNETTGIIEVIVEHIGYETELTNERMLEVASVAGRMAGLVRKYRTEVQAAMSTAEPTAGTEVSGPIGITHQ
jgi:hypothetical protein